MIGGAATGGPRSDRVRVLQYILIGAAVFALLFLLWRVREAVLLGFAAVTLAVVLGAAADPIERHTLLSRPWALAVVGLALLVATVGFVYLLGAQVQTQVASLAARLPEAARSLTEALGLELPSRGNSSGDTVPSLEDLLRSVASFGTTLVSAATSLVLVVVAAFFLASDPETYRRGVVRLFPLAQQPRIDETMQSCGRALRYWLIAELIAMSLVGVLVGVGTWIIGLPAPLALALFAFVMEFIPMVGPIIGAIPGLLLAASQDGQTLLWTALLYLAVQQLESNVITPMVERRMVTIPPALLLLAVTAFGLLFGIVGVIIAAPLTVVLYVAVQKLYIEHTLGQTSSVPGET